MKHTHRILAFLLALLLLIPAALADDIDDLYAEEDLLGDVPAIGVFGYSEEDALAEEGALDAFDAQPGDYEWYILPAEPSEGCAYVDIYPSDDVLYNTDGSWTFSFTIQEVTGISYQPYVLTIICFANQQELTRTAYDIDTLNRWWRNNAVLCNNTVVYEGLVTAPDITAVAISMIGIDEYGHEMEFHSMIDVRDMNSFMPS